MRDIRRVWGCAAAAVLFGLVPAGIVAQIPGGRDLSAERERATFRATVLGQIRPLLDSWEGAWRGDAGSNLEGLFTPDGVIAARDSLIGGPRAIADFAREARGRVGALSPSLLDFDASDKLAYVYGAWSAIAPETDTRATGRVATIFRKSGREWMIRCQVFSADSAGTGLTESLNQVEPLPSLERRVAVGARAMVPFRKGDRERQDAQSVERIRVYRELIRSFAAVRIAWNADDADALYALMRGDAWLHLPGVQNWAGRVTVPDLQRVLADYGNLYTSELDFDQGGSMAYLAGRYVAERGEGPSESGSYLAVFQNLGAGWMLRSLSLL